MGVGFAIHSIIFTQRRFCHLCYLRGTYFLIKVGWCLSRRPSLRLFLKPISSIYYIILNHKIINTGVRGRTSLNPIIPIAPNQVSCVKGHTLRISTLGCLRTQNNALHVLSRTALDHAPPKVGPGQGFSAMGFNATFNNISAISWQSVLLVERTTDPRNPMTKT